MKSDMTSGGYTEAQLRQILTAMRSIIADPRTTPSMLAATKAGLGFYEEHLRRVRG